MLDEGGLERTKLGRNELISRAASIRMSSDHGWGDSSNWWEDREWLRICCKMPRSFQRATTLHHELKNTCIRTNSTLDPGKNKREVAQKKRKGEKGKKNDHICRSWKVKGWNSYKLVCIVQYCNIKQRKAKKSSTDAGGVCLNYAHLFRIHSNVIEYLIEPPETSHLRYYFDFQSMFVVWLVYHEQAHYKAEIE